ncbi:MAG: hypothetical protein ACOYJF_04435 [Prevotella sp.]
MRRYVSCLFLLLSFIVSLQIKGATTPTITLSKTADTVALSQYRYTPPQVFVYDGEKNVTNLFYINYYIEGQENNVQTVEGNSVTVGPVTGTTVSVLYGLVTVGDNAGTDKIRVIAKPRTSDYSQVETSYTLTVSKVTPVAHLSQDTIIAYAGEVIGLPTAVLLNDEGDTITSKYSVGYTMSDGITECNYYKGRSVPDMINIPAATGINEYITMTYTPTSDYINNYEIYTKTYHVNVVERPGGNIPTTMDWPEGNTKNMATFNSFRPSNPRVRDDLGNDITQLFTYKYEIGSSYSTQSIGIWTSNGYWNTWYGNVYAYGRWGFCVTIHSFENMNNPAENDGFTTCSDSCYLNVSQHQDGIGGISVAVTPSTYYTYSDILNKDNWSLPTITVTENGYELTNAWKVICIPAEGVTTNLSQNSGFGDTLIYKGTVYKMYPAYDWEFQGDWYIDYTNYTGTAPRLLIAANNWGQIEYGRNVQDYQLIKMESLTTTLTLDQYEVTANIVSNKLVGFTEPEATIVDINGKVVTDHFTLSYSIDNADEATATGISIDSSTGAISFTGTTVTNAILKIRVKATPLAADEEKWSAPKDTVYQLHLLQTDLSYEVIHENYADTASVYGKFHFLGGATMASGTIINGVPGISVQFGNSSNDVWDLEQGTVTDDEGSNKGTENKRYFTAGAPGQRLSADGVPQDGTFLVLRPYANGFLTLDAQWEKDNVYVLLIDDNGAVSRSQSYKPAADAMGEYRLTYPLMAGKTYYFFNFGESDGTNEPFKLHGLNFEPAFLVTDKDKVPSHHSTTYVNGYTGNISELISEANSCVSFYVDEVPGTKSGIVATDYATVDESTGEVTPLKTTSGITEDTVTSDAADRIYLKAKVWNRELGSDVYKTPWLYLFVSNIPSYIVENGDQPAVGQKVTTENISTPIVMTFGGWITGAGPYKKLNTKTGVYEDILDSWKTAKTDTVGQNNMTIDGFRFASQGSQNAADEDGNSFQETIADGSHQPWEVPCRGTYLKFEPRDNGTLMVYLLQNGCLDYTGSGQWDDVKNGYKLKYRPLFIVDETGNAVKLDNSWAIDPSLLPSNSRQQQFAGRFTEGLYRAYWKDATVSSLLTQHGISVTTDVGEGYEGCSFDLSNFKSHPDDLDSLMTQWKKYDNTSVYQRQEIVRFTQGYALVSKAFVRYTFQVKAGKTYYVYMKGSKLSCCGFSFVPTYYGQTAPEQLTVDFTDNDTFSDVFTKAVVDKNNLNTKSVSAKGARRAASSNSTSTEELDNISVRLNRKFTSGKWTGLCLPFSISESRFKEIFGDDALVITYDSVQGDSAFFSQHVYHQIVANYPFFIRPSKDVAADQVIDSVTVEGDYAAKAITDNNGDYISTGLFAPATAQSGSYVFAGDNIYHLKTARQLSAYRAYLNPASANAAPFTHFAMITAGTGTTLTDEDEDSPVTGIRDLLADESIETESTTRQGIYNLQGVFLGSDEQLLEKLPQGVYIVNGKKCVVTSH